MAGWRAAARPGRYRGHVGVQVGVDPDGDRALWCWQAVMTVPSGLIGQGRHAPIGTVDNTAMGLSPGSDRVTPPDRWVPCLCPGSWPTAQTQATKPVRRRVSPATEGTTQIIAARTFSTTSRPALRAAAGRP